LAVAGRNYYCSSGFQLRGHPEEVGKNDINLPLVETLEFSQMNGETTPTTILVIVVVFHLILIFLGKCTLFCIVKKLE